MNCSRSPTQSFNIAHRTLMLLLADRLVSESDKMSGITLICWFYRLLVDRANWSSIVLFRLNSCERSCINVTSWSWMMYWRIIHESALLFNLVLKSGIWLKLLLLSFRNFLICTTMMRIVLVVIILRYLSARIVFTRLLDELRLQLNLRWWSWSFWRSLMMERRNTWRDVNGIRQWYLVNWGIKISRGLERLINVVSSFTKWIINTGLKSSIECVFPFHWLVYLLVESVFFILYFFFNTCFVLWSKRFHNFVNLAPMGSRLFVMLFGFFCGSFVFFFLPHWFIFGICWFMLSRLMSPSIVVFDWIIPS